MKNFIKNKIREVLLNESRVKTHERINIYRDNNYIVVRPLTERASCKYGAYTRWCISAPSSGAWESNPNTIVIMIIQRNYTMSPEKEDLIEKFLYLKDVEENGELTPEMEEELMSLYHNHESHEFEDLSKIALIFGNNQVEIWDANNIPITDNYYGWDTLPISDKVINAIENYIKKIN